MYCYVEKRKKKPDISYYYHEEYRLKGQGLIINEKKINDGLVKVLIFRVLQ